MADLRDQQLGNYRLMRVLGQGGFADVYLGEHVLLGTPAALKVHHTRIEGANLERFEQEARTIARLNHPHIVRVLEYGVQDGVAYLVMSYASEGTLRQCHPEGTRVALPTVVEYVRQMASALHYAHEQQLVHRDVKPENMLLDDARRVLLSDFGIAIQARSTASLGTQDAIGTVTYMAPEQLRKKARPASDQYALATIAYEWLAGEPPFEGAPIEVALQHLNDPVPSLAAKVSDLPRGIEDVLLRALAKEPEQRFPTIAAFAETLEQAARGEQVEKFSGAGISLSPERGLAMEKPPARKGVSISRRDALTLGLIGTGIVGSGIAGFVWNRATMAASRTGDATGILSAAWSPGGNLYALADASGLVMIYQRVDQQQWSMTYPRTWSLAWSPDEGQTSRLALAGADGNVRIIDVASQKLVSIYAGHQSAHVLSVVWSAGQYAPGGIISGDSTGAIHIWDPTSGATRLTVQQAAPVTDLATNSSTIYFIAAGTPPGGTYHVWDRRTGTSMFQYTNANTGDSDTPYMSINQSLTPGTITAVGWSGYGNVVAVGDSNGNIHFLSDTDCSCFLHMGAFQAHTARINAISWTSAPPLFATTRDDGSQRFATASDDGTVKTWKINVTNQTTGGSNIRADSLKTFTNGNGAFMQAVAWSPDGTQLLYGDSAGNTGIWQV